MVGWEETVTGINSADWLARQVPEDAIIYWTQQRGLACERPEAASALPSVPGPIANIRSA